MSTKKKPKPEPKSRTGLRERLFPQALKVVTRADHLLTSIEAEKLSVETLNVIQTAIDLANSIIINPRSS